MSNDYIPFHPNPSAPKLKVLEGAVDAHCHVFGPADTFPFAQERKYTPVDSPKEKLFELRDHLGFSRNVIVQATCHGRDNSALVDALMASNGAARGVAIIGEDITDDELQNLDGAGVRAVRFNFVKRLVDTTPWEVFEKIAQKVEKLGWHIVVYFEAQDLEELKPLLARLPGIVVVDHMGRPDIAQGVEGDAFQNFLKFMDEHENIWVKVSCPERLTNQGPPYDDVIPFAATLVKRFTNRVLWGTDWPHPNMKSHMPDDGMLVDTIGRIAPSVSDQQALLIDNPVRLYWPEENNAKESKV